MHAMDAALQQQKAASLAEPLGHWRAAPGHWPIWMRATVACITVVAHVWEGPEEEGARVGPDGVGGKVNTLGARVTGLLGAFVMGLLGAAVSGVLGAEEQDCVHRARGSSASRAKARPARTCTRSPPS
jgi:hypothetical protein